MSVTLNAQARSEVGKGASRRLRREAGIIPAIIYGAGQDPQNISMLQKDILERGLSLSNLDDLEELRRIASDSDYWRELGR